MEGKIMRVVQQGEAFAVQSQKSENGQMMKCNIVLQEMGGKYENQYAAAMLGNVARVSLLREHWWRLRSVSRLVSIMVRFIRISWLQILKSWASKLRLDRQGK